MKLILLAMTLNFLGCTLSESSGRKKWESNQTFFTTASVSKVSFIKDGITIDGPEDELKRESQSCFKGDFLSEQIDYYQIDEDQSILVFVNEEPFCQVWLTSKSYQNL